MSSTNILLLHLFSNGDCLFATTIAKQIKFDYPNSHLTWMIASNCKSMILNNPYVDEIIEVDISVYNDKELIFNQCLKSAQSQKEEGIYDHIFVSQIIGDTFSNYDSCVRTSIYRCYGKPITVSPKPVLILNDEEKDKALNFFTSNELHQYKNVILFECAPMSGQVIFTVDFIKSFASQIVKSGDTAIILSSAKKIPVDINGVFDGSILTIRETVALSEHCTLLLGCSSGITWATTSIESRQIPMVQLLDPNAYIYNPPSIGFSKVGESTEVIIELYRYDLDLLIKCTKHIFENSFQDAKKVYNQKAKSNFRIFRGITHTFIKRKKYKLLKQFILMNLNENGFNLKMIKMIAIGILFYPVQSMLNKKHD